VQTMRETSRILGASPARKARGTKGAKGVGIQRRAREAVAEEAQGGVQRPDAGIQAQEKRASQAGAGIGEAIMKLRQIPLRLRHWWAGHEWKGDYGSDPTCACGKEYCYDSAVWQGAPTEFKMWLFDKFGPCPDCGKWFVGKDHCLPF